MIVYFFIFDVALFDTADSTQTRKQLVYLIITQNSKVVHHKQLLVAFNSYAELSNVPPSLEGGVWA